MQLAEFWDHVEKTDTCWLWTRSCQPSGYGQLSLGGTMVLAHRVAWQLINGPVPDGTELDHRPTCPKRCVRPDHLRPATRKQNEENRAGPQRNNTSGYRGVSWFKPVQKWRAYATHNGRQHSFGYYDTPEEANQAAIKGRNRLFTHNDADRQMVP